jgi:hypothetical protein
MILFQGALRIEAMDINVVTPSPNTIFLKLLRKSKLKKKRVCDKILFFQNIMPLLDDF